MSDARTSQLRRLARPCAGLGLLLALLGAAADDEAAYGAAKQDLERLLKDPSRARQREPYQKLIARFDALATPASPVADRAAFMAARTCEELSLASRVPADLDQALQRMQQVAAQHAGSRLADDALLAAARMHLERRSDQNAARELLTELLARFPHGDMASPARELLARLPAPASPAAVSEPASVVTPARADTSASTEREAVDRIGELLKKAELIRAEAGSADAPQAAVLEAEAALSAAEHGGTALAHPLAGSAASAPTSAPAETDAAAYQPAPRKPLRQATSERPARLRRVVARPVELGLELQLQLDGEVSFAPGEAAAEPDKKMPRRIYYDLTPAKLERTARECSLSDTSLTTRVRCGQNTLDTARVVIELQPGTEVAPPQPCAGGLCILLTTENLRQQASDRARQLAAAARPQPAAAAPEPPPAPSPAAPASAPAAPLATVLVEAPSATAPQSAPAEPNPAMLPSRPSSGGMSLSQQVGLQVRTVVIDPGHGGNDPGAIGPTGLQEKDVTLKVAKRVAARLEKELGLQVVLTRDRDKTLSLEERAAIANDARADLFISVHVNASPNRKAYGIETFYLNTTDDRYAIRLAARENAGSEKSIGDLQFILADLVTKSNVDDSRRLAKAVQSGMVAQASKRYSDVKDLGLKSALFYVLIGVRMPSVLVETSFISNRREEKRLRQDAYLDALADGIVRGVRAFTETQTAART